MVLKKAASAGIMTALAVLGITFGSSAFVSGYEITAAGQVIGRVADSGSYDKITDEINSEISDTYGINSDIESELKLTKKIISKNSLTAEDELKENIKKTSGLMSRALVLSINDSEAVNFSEYDDMVSVLGEILSLYKIDDGQTDFTDKLEYEEKYVCRAKILSREEAFNYLTENKLLNIKTTVLTEYKAAVPFKTIETEDDTMYKGSVVTVTDGVTGESLVKDEVTYINGEETERRTVSEKTVTEPINEKILTGTLEPPAGYGTGSFDAPINGRFTSGYGQRWGRLHGGIDLAAPTGTQIKASDNGTVSFVGESGSYGLLVKIDHGNGYVTYYAHCSGFLVNEGDVVQKGESIALVGSTGNSTGPHCHFEIRYNGEQLDPTEFIDVK